MRFVSTAAATATALVLLGTLTGCAAGATTIEEVFDKLGCERELEKGNAYARDVDYDPLLPRDGICRHMGQKATYFYEAASNGDLDEVIRAGGPSQLERTGLNSAGDSATWYRDGVVLLRVTDPNVAEEIADQFQLVELPERE